MDPTLEAWLRELWANRGLPFSDANLKQAWLIAGAEALPNPNGTAPGWWIERDGKVIIALPGPPRELHPMWHDHALPRLQARGLGDRPCSRDVASHRHRQIGPGRRDRQGVTGGGEPTSCHLRPAGLRRPAGSAPSRRGDAAPRELVDRAIAALSPRLDPFVFGRNDDDWSVVLARRLGSRRVATIEVGTGGYLAMLLGASPFLLHAEQDVATNADAATLAAGRLPAGQGRTSALPQWPGRLGTTCRSRSA